MSKSKKKKNKTSKKIYFSAARIITYVVLAAVFVTIGYVWKNPIEQFLNGAENAVYQMDDNGLTVHFMDVGQGDSIVIEFPDDKVMLVDAGPEDSADKIVTYLDQNVFENGREKVFDYLLLTHSDEDHCGAIPTVLDTFDADLIFRPKIYSSLIAGDGDGVIGAKKTVSTNCYADTITAFENENCPVVFTDIFECNATYRIEGGTDEQYYRIVFYAPTDTYYDATNDFSPIMVIEYQDKTIMLTGDASEESEALTLTDYTLPQVDVLKVGHHGSSTSTSSEFLNAIQPTYAVISVGTGNTYGHPAQATLNRLAFVGASVFRTDQLGTILANISSINGTVLVAAQIKEQAKMEYFLIGILLVSGYFCFFLSYGKSDDKGNKK